MTDVHAAGEPVSDRDVIFEVVAGEDGPHVIVDGRLDIETGRELCDTVRAILVRTDGGVVVDLSDVARYTTDGLRAVVACARLGDDHDRQVRIRLGRPRT